MASVVVQTRLASDYEDLSKGQVANTYRIPVATNIVQTRLASDYEDVSKGQVANTYRIPVASKVAQISISWSSQVFLSQRTIQKQ